MPALSTVTSEAWMLQPIGRKVRVNEKPMDGLELCGPCDGTPGCHVELASFQGGTDRRPYGPGLRVAGMGYGGLWEVGAAARLITFEGGAKWALWTVGVQKATRPMV